MRVLYTLPALLLILAGCGEDAGPSAEAEPTEAVTTTTASSDSETIAEPTGVLPLADGYLEPGRYRHVVSMDWCNEVKNDPIACPKDIPLPPPIPVVVTVPSGWAGSNEFHLIQPVGLDTEPPGGALVMGWTSHSVGIQSDPCLSKNHQTPDVRVGLSVDDFVEAVTAQPWFDFPAPVETKIGGASGQYFTLTGPGQAELDKCKEWRPWDPGFYAQGPDNTWEVWVLDVRGHRVVIVIQYFPSTSEQTVEELRDMVGSIRFPAN